MADFLTTTLELVSQFTGGSGREDRNIVRFVLAAIAWAVLLTLARQRQKQRNLPQELLLTMGFTFALARELFMLGRTALLRAVRQVLHPEQSAHQAAPGQV